MLIRGIEFGLRQLGEVCISMFCRLQDHGGSDYSCSWIPGWMRIAAGTNAADEAVPGC